MSWSRSGRDVGFTGERGALQEEMFDFSPTRPQGTKYLVVIQLSRALVMTEEA